MENTNNNINAYSNNKRTDIDFNCNYVSTVLLINTIEDVKIAYDKTEVILIIKELSIFNDDV